MSFLKSIFRKPPADAPGRTPAVPASAEDAKQRGNRHLTQGELNQAADCYRDALRLNPNFAEAYNNLGYVLRQQGRFAEATAMLDMALAINPDLGPAHLNQGIVAATSGRHDAAEQFFRQAAAFMPENPECHWRLGDLLVELDRHEQAIPAYQVALALHPELPETRINLGSVYYNLGRWDEAQRHYRIALEIHPHSAPAAYFLGMTEQVQGRTDAAIAGYQLAIDFEPDHVRAHWNLSMLLLLRGDLRNGWQHYEKRLLATASGDKSEWLKDIKRYLPLLGEQGYWRGQPLAGKCLLLWDEQGLGDSLMMMRYLPRLKADHAAARILVYCDPRLSGLVARLPGVDAVIAKTQAIDPACFDLHCSMMSLPCRFQSNTEDTIPHAVPYLAVSDTASMHWEGRLAAIGTQKKVGLVWGGNKDMARDALRSVALDTLAPLLEIPGIDWISLQKGEPASQLKSRDWPIIDWMDECRDMLDTAALVANLDLVISVDTSVAHLAGALGRPVWLLNRHESEWRWMLDREDSPWYPTLRIFTQPMPADWASVIDTIRRELLRETLS